MLFSFEPKDMQVAYANNTNSAIMAQDLTGEGLTHMKFWIKSSLTAGTASSAQS